MRALLFALTLSCGVGGLQTWRLHRAHQSIAAKDVALARAGDDLEAAAVAIKTRDLAIRDNAADERRDATELASIMKGTCRAAFDAGYAARRCVGGDSAFVSDGLRDLRALQSAGAFPGAPGLPGQP